MTTRIDLLCSKSARIPRGGDETGTPFAYLNYLVFNEQYVAVDGGAWRVPQTAGFNPGQEAQGYTEANNKVKFNEPITINQTGYIYVWVSNETEATKVWFDDLSVVHRKNIVSQATDYETWGGVLREQKYNPDEEYRHGYQGKYAEKDEETGWEHFEAREYDPLAGRWMVKDPKRQHWSPYLSMGNNPISNVDPDGAYTKVGAFLRSVVYGGGPIYNSGGGSKDWGFSRQSGSEMIEGSRVPIYSHYFGREGEESLAGAVWNHPYTRYQIPDFATVGGGFNGIAIFGGGSSIELNWVLRGPEASWKPAITVTQTIGAGYSVDATLNIGGANYLGSVNDIRRGMLETSIGQGGLTYWGSAGIAAGGKIGLTGTYTPTPTGYGIVGRYLNIGAGLPAGPLPANASGGVSNTFIIKDFHK